MPLPSSPLALLSLACAALAAILLLWFLLRRPRLDGTTKLLLLLGLGVFPIGAATTGNVQGFHATKQRNFCGSCHVMTPYTHDSEDRTSPSLASRHARTRLFGEENCYVCHADYGMFGPVTTKLNGLSHVYEYFTGYRTMPLDEAREKIHLYAPYKNDNCMQCHSTELDLWRRVPDHQSSLQETRDGRISCASSGCHGYAHPFSKPATSASAAPRGSR